MQKAVSSPLISNLSTHTIQPITSLYTITSLRDCQPNCTNYVFLDEVQHVEHFEKAADGLYVRDDVDLYITGSNANLLSSELATLLTGRYVELKMLPLSFSEYRNALQSTANDNALFDRYLTYGGLPYVTQLTEDLDIADYLGGVFNTILVADIAQRNPRMDMRAFNDVAAFLADNVGNLASLKSMSGGLGRKRPPHFSHHNQRVYRRNGS